MWLCLSELCLCREREREIRLIFRLAARLLSSCLSFPMLISNVILRLNIWSCYSSRIKLHSDETDVRLVSGGLFSFHFRLDSISYLDRMNSIFIPLLLLSIQSATARGKTHDDARRRRNLRIFMSIRWIIKLYWLESDIWYHLLQLKRRRGEKMRFRSSKHLSWMMTLMNRRSSGSRVKCWSVV